MVEHTIYGVKNENSLLMIREYLTVVGTLLHKAIIRGHAVNSDFLS